MNILGAANDDSFQKKFQGHQKDLKEQEVDIQESTNKYANDGKAAMEKGLQDALQEAADTFEKDQTNVEARMQAERDKLAKLRGYNKAIEAKMGEDSKQMKSSADIVETKAKAEMKEAMKNTKDKANELQEASTEQPKKDDKA